MLETLEKRTLLHGGALSGFVYVDADGDGTRDVGEVSVPGIQVNLTGGDAEQQSRITDDNGFYSFDDLEPGTYQISKRQSTAMIDGQDSTSVPGAVASENQFTNVVLGNEQTLGGSDFAERSVHPDYVSIAWFFASAPPLAQILREAVALGAERDGDQALADMVRAGGTDAPPAVNRPPISADDTFTVAADTTLNIGATAGVLANDTDPEIDPLTATLVDQATNGTATLEDDGSFTYTPNSGFSGADSFTYQASDSMALSNVATVRIDVAADANQDPLASNDAYVSSIDETLTVAAASGVLANDSDPDGDPLTAMLVDQAINGVVTLESDGAFTYTPDDGFSGTDTFAYRADDSAATSNLATVTITVNPPDTGTNQAPVATGEAYHVRPGNLLTTTPASGLLANDTDADGDMLTATLVDQASNGVAILADDGSFTYTPDAGFAGADMFTYRVSDGTVTSNLATVSIAVVDTGNEPFAAVTTGSFEEEDLLGIRTDLEEGAPPITAEHVTNAVDYSAYSNPPTYGPHHGFQVDASNNSITPRPTGVYSTEQPDEDLVHNLEHGHVWISYDPALANGAFLHKLIQLVEEGGTDTGVIMTPRSSNTSAIALASWGRLLTISDDLIRASESFSLSRVRSFIEMNRGHAPEGFIPSGQKTAASESLDDGLPHSS